MVSSFFVLYIMRKSHFHDSFALNEVTEKSTDNVIDKTSENSDNDTCSDNSQQNLTVSLPNDENLSAKSEKDDVNKALHENTDTDTELNLQKELNKEINSESFSSKDYSEIGIQVNMMMPNRSLTTVTSNSSIPARTKSPYMYSFDDSDIEDV